MALLIRRLAEKNCPVRWQTEGSLLNFGTSFTILMELFYEWGDFVGYTVLFSSNYKFSLFKLCVSLDFGISETKKRVDNSHFHNLETRDNFLLGWVELGVEGWVQLSRYGWENGNHTHTHTCTHAHYRAIFVPHTHTHTHTHAYSRGKTRNDPARKCNARCVWCV